MCDFKHNNLAIGLTSVRPSVSLSVSLSVCLSLCSVFYSNLNRARGHTQRDSPGGSMRRGQRTFRPNNKEDLRAFLRAVHSSTGQVQ